MKDKDCVLCGKNNFKLLNRHGIIEKGGKIKDFDNYICKKCGLVFIYPQPSSDDYSKIYSEYEKSRHMCDNEDVVSKFIDGSNYQQKSTSIYNFIKEFLGEEKNVLDIGAGFGQISRGLKEFCKINAIEPSVVLSKIIRERFGLEAFTGNFDDFYIVNNKRFDLLIMHHVFEHFIDPNTKLSQFKNILSLRGVIYIEIPNVVAFKKPVNHFFDYMHPFSYSPKTIKELIYKNNYKIIKVNKDKKYRLQIVIALKDTNYQDIGMDNYWKSGGLWATYYFIQKRKLIDMFKKNYVNRH